jgi:hypothetical protein
LGFAVALTLFGLQRLADLDLGHILAGGGAVFAASIRGGFLLVGLTGLAVLGHDGIASRVAGWLGLSAIFSFAIWLLIVLDGVSRALAATNSRFAVGLFAPELAASSRKAAQRDLIERVSFSILDEVVRGEGGELTVWLPLTGADAEDRVARTSSSAKGVVHDIHLGRLRAALRRTRHPPETLRVATRIGGQIRPGNAIAQSTGPMDPATRSDLASSVHVSAEVRLVGEVVDQLHRLALASVRKQDGLLEVVLDAYDRGLEAYASVWTPHVDVLRQDHQFEWLRPDTSPNGAIKKSIGKLLRTAVVEATIEDLDALSYYPLRATQRAVKQRAEAYFAFLDLYPLMYRLSGDQREPIGNYAFIRDRSWRFLSEALRLVLPSMMSSHDPAIDAAMVSAARVAVRRNMFEVGAAAIAANDFDTFARVARYLRRSAPDDD